MSHLMNSDCPSLTVRNGSSGVAPIEFTDRERLLQVERQAETCEYSLKANRMTDPTHGAGGFTSSLDFPIDEQALQSGVDARDVSESCASQPSRIAQPNDHDVLFGRGSK
jgi:hypothetical protein